MTTASRKNIRSIVVEGRRFVWNYRSGWGRDTFSAYSADHRTSPLRIYFHASSGTPGTVFGADPPEAEGINLYTPAWAATLIRYALSHGWQVDSSGNPLVIEDGAGVLAALDYMPTRDTTV